MDVKPGFLGPLLAVVLAVGAGGAMLSRYTSARSEALYQWRAETAAQAVVSDADRLALASRLTEAGITSRLVVDDTAPRKYDVLHRLNTLTPTGAKALNPLSDEDKATADAFVGGLSKPRTARVPGVVRVARPVDARTVVVVDGPAPEPAPLPWLLLVGLALIGFGGWAALAKVGLGKRWPAVVGGALAAASVLGGLAWALSAVEGQFAALIGGVKGVLAAAPEAPAAQGGALAFAAALIPIVAYAVAGFISGSRRSPHRMAFTYVTPAMVGMAVLILVPFGLGVLLAFMRHSHGNFTFVGLDNFISILRSEGYSITHPLSFYYTLAVTVLWTATNVFLHASIGLGLALILREPTLRFKGIYRVLLIIPWAVPNYITALVWKGMFNKQYGLINHVIQYVGIEPVSWFSQFWTSFSANLTTNTWLGFPFMMLVSLGALQSIPRDLYEAAEVDGASKWQQFKAITIPLLKPALFPAIILGSIWTFNMFNIIYLVSGGQPNNSTDILIVNAYRWAFEQDRYGYAAAYSMLIFFILLGYSTITSRVSKAAEEACG